MERLYGLWKEPQKMLCSSDCFDEYVSGRKKSIIMGALTGRYGLLISNVLGNVFRRERRFRFMVCLFRGGRWKTKPPMNWKAKGRTSNNGDKLEVFVIT